MKHAPQKILINNGRVVDPLTGSDGVKTLAIERGHIVYLGEKPPDDFKPDTVINAENLLILPGLIDMHVHLREPGRPDKETIETGCMAAAAGGFTDIACMPNTNPIIDDENKIEFVKKKAENTACRVHPVGAITLNFEGKELAPLKKMAQHDAIAFSEDGKCVADSNLMVQAAKLAKDLNKPLLCHCEDSYLVKDGHVNDSHATKHLGIQGIPGIAEEIMVARDALIAQFCNARIHICHVSTAGSVRLIRWAKQQGIAITAETCPHYFILTDQDVSALDTNKKMSPPLRGALDRIEILNGIADGTIDVIASDHAPHTMQEKNNKFESAPNGVVGLETIFAASYTHLVQTNRISLMELVNKLSLMPKKILNLPLNPLIQGSRADLTIVDPHAEWTVHSAFFQSKGRNTAFEGHTFKSLVLYTILEGSIVYRKK